MSISESLSNLISVVEGAKADADKFESGVRGSDGAGTKVRGTMQEVKNMAQAIREEVSAIRDQRKK